VRKTSLDNRPSGTGGADSNSAYPCGVSVIICCHNSASRLGPTLDHLAKQRCTPELPWEIVVVDNACTDQTADVAAHLWPRNHPQPLRIVREDKVGLSNARATGLAGAAYEYVTFADDDNWLCPEWVQTVADTFREHPDVGMLTGRGDAVFEAAPPSWFDNNKRSYAIGAASGTAGHVPAERICGAGMCLRHSAWDALKSVGFSSILPDRQGLALTAGGDTELVVGLSFLGWKAWFEPRLSYKHWISADRLTMQHLRRLHRDYGTSSMVLHMYIMAKSQSSLASSWRIRHTWLWHVTSNVRSLCRALVNYGIRLRRGDTLQALLSIEGCLGTIRALVATGPGRYRVRRQSIARLYRACQLLATEYETSGRAA